ncbi:MAG: hypothetical protein INQ03_15785 [Candidatus Heimdallarchaeota archaeon]|nr:hypothetical protein [Candidatus Heimdallarchaeota archaeon]
MGNAIAHDYTLTEYLRYGKAYLIFKMLAKWISISLIIYGQLFTLAFITDKISRSFVLIVWFFSLFVLGIIISRFSKSRDDGIFFHAPTKLKIFYNFLLNYFLIVITMNNTFFFIMLVSPSVLFTYGITYFVVFLLGLLLLVLALVLVILLPLWNLLEIIMPVKDYNMKIIFTEFFWENTKQMASNLRSFTESVTDILYTNYNTTVASFELGDFLDYAPVKYWGVVKFTYFGALSFLLFTSALFFGYYVSILLIRNKEIQEYQMNEKRIIRKSN